MNKSKEHWWNETKRGELKYYLKKPVVVPLYPPQIVPVPWGPVMRERPKDRFRESTQFCHPPRNLSRHFCRQPTGKPTDRLWDIRDSTSERISVHSSFLPVTGRIFFCVYKLLRRNNLHVCTTYTTISRVALHQRHTPYIYHSPLLTALTHWHTTFYNTWRTYIYIYIYIYIWSAYSWCF